MKQDHVHSMITESWWEACLWMLTVKLNLSHFQYIVYLDYKLIKALSNSVGLLVFRWQMHLSIFFICILCTVIAWLGAHLYFFCDRIIETRTTNTCSITSKKYLYGVWFLFSVFFPSSSYNKFSDNMLFFYFLSVIWCVSLSFRIGTHVPLTFMPP